MPTIRYGFEVRSFETMFAHPSDQVYFTMARVREVFNRHVRGGSIVPFALLPQELHLITDELGAKPAITKAVQELFEGALVKGCYSQIEPNVSLKLAHLVQIVQTQLFVRRSAQWQAIFALQARLTEFLQAARQPIDEVAIMVSTEALDGIHHAVSLCFVTCPKAPPTTVEEALRLTQEGFEWADHLSTVLVLGNKTRAASQFNL